MKICEDCGKEISNSAITCPNCGKNVKTPILGIILFVILAIIVLTAVFGEKDVAKKSGDNKDNKNVIEKKEKKTVFNQNDVVDYKGVKYSITGVKRTQGSNQFYKPADGKEYIIINVKIENSSNEKISFNSLNWKILLSNGEEKTTFGNIIIEDNDTKLSAGDLNPGGVKTGSLSFEVPKGDKVSLKFYGNVFGKTESFKIEIKD